MEKKICVIILYFGKFPDTIDAFLKSCKNNPEFDWIIFTDDKLKHVPENVKLIECTLLDIKGIIEEKLGYEVALDKPYKLCDFRPAFGVVFEEYLKEYDFWGYGDVDLIYGDLSCFITDELLEKYDKIYPCGHLSLLRNSPEINNVFMQSVEGTWDYKQVFLNEKSWIFDEYKGINEKLLSLGKKVYGQIDFADMDVVYRRFRTADKRTLRVVFPKYLFKQNLPKNYKYQSFLYKKGKTYRVFVDRKGEVSYQEVVYIHYRHKIHSKINAYEEDLYWVTPSGFVTQCAEIEVGDIILTNIYKGEWEEIKQYVLFLKENLICRLGKNKKLRKFVRSLKRKEKFYE